MLSTGSRAGRLGLWRTVAISLLCWGFLSALEWSGAFSVVDLRMLDLRFRLRGERVAESVIALIEVDDATIGAYGQWPLPRDTYALLLAGLADAGARAVGVDLLFAGHDPEDRQSDFLLAAVTANSPNVCHSISFSAASPTPAPEASPSAPALEMLRRHGIPDAHDVGAPLADDALLPFAELLESSGALGHATVAVDRDGGLRRVPLLIRYRGDLYPALGLRLAGLARGHEALPQVEPDGRGVTIVWPDGERLRVPVDNEGGTAIDFAGDRGAFPRRYSMVEVLRWIREGDRARVEGAFRGQTVLIGNTAAGEAATDLGTTPFAVATPLVYIHANVVDAVLAGRFLVTPPRPVFLLVLAGLSILLGWLFASLPFRPAVGTMAGALGLIAGLEYAFFVLWRINLPSTLPLLLPVLVYVTIETYRSVFMERRAQERDKELEIARQVQQKLFPSELPTADGWEFAGMCRPAREVGGDYYDLLRIDPSHVAFALGDVSGKGLGPSLLMSNVHAMVRSHLHRPGADPASLVTELNEHLCSSTSPGMFITFFLGILDVETGVARYVNGGHNPGLLVGGDTGTLLRLEVGGMVVGAMAGVGFEQGEVTLEPGSTLTLVSDGVTEAMDEKGDMFGEERLESALVSAAGSGATATLRRVVESVERFRGRRELPDDLSVVVIHRQAGGD